MSRDKTETVELATLGRPFRLGMLYDCRNDSLIPGITLWELNKIRESIDVRTQRNTNFQVITCDSIEEKATSLDVSASLKVSLLGGMISLKGSAGYFNNSRSSKNQARITLQYRTTTKFEQLTMSQLGQQNIAYRDVFDQGTATHVVTGVLYGAQAFFIFDREISSNETIQTAKGSMQGALKMLGGLIGGEVKGSVEYSDMENAKVDQIRCTFYGDFKLNANPVTFQEAVRVYSKLPEYLGPEDVHAVPIKVWLYPLKLLDDQAAKLLREISVELVYRSQSVMEQLGNYECQCNDLMRNEVATKFHEIKAKAGRFKELCQVYKLMFQKNLAQVLPRIRGGVDDDSVLADILIRKEQSPFKDSALIQWLENKNTEKNVVKAYLTMMRDIMVMAKRSELEEVILDPRGEYVLCFVFTSLHGAEPFLQVLSEYLKNMSDTDIPIDSGGSLPEPWFSCPEMSQHMRTLAKHFLEFVEINKNGKTKFLIASERDTDYPGVSIYLYEEGRLETRNFQPPCKPSAPSLHKRAHDSITLKFEPLKYGADDVKKYRIEYALAPFDRWVFQDTNDPSETFMVSGLHPHTQYKFRYKAVTKPGVSATSDNCDLNTCPASAPSSVQVCETGSRWIEITWKQPEVLGNNVTVYGYAVQYKTEKEDSWSTVICTSNAISHCSIKITKLMSDTLYMIRVMADCGEAGYGEPSTAVIARTSRKFWYETTGTLVRDGSPAIYKLEMKTMAMVKDRCCKLYSLGQPAENQEERTILLMGVRGQHKTLLLNAMINYILGVKFEDEFRFVLPHSFDTESEVDGPIQWMMGYQVHFHEDHNLPYSLTILDAPGYGEWRCQNLLIDDQIRAFSHECEFPNELNAVCLVVGPTDIKSSSVDHVFHQEVYMRKKDLVFAFPAIVCDLDLGSACKHKVSDIQGSDMNVVMFWASDDAQLSEYLHNYTSEAKLELIFKYSDKGLLEKNDDKAQDLWATTMSSLDNFFSHLKNFECKNLIIPYH